MGRVIPGQCLESKTWPPHRMNLWIRMHLILMNQGDLWIDRKRCWRASAVSQGRLLERVAWFFCELGKSYLSDSLWSYMSLVWTFYCILKSPWHLLWNYQCSSSVNCPWGIHCLYGSPRDVLTRLSTLIGREISGFLRRRWDSNWTF